MGSSCPGNRNRAFLAAVVAMGTGMLTKACEAEKTNCPHHYLRACQSNIFPYLPRRGESPGSTRRGREREESCLPQTPHWGGSISSPSGWPPSPAIASPRSTSSSRNWASKLETGLGCSKWGCAPAGEKPQRCWELLEMGERRQARSKGTRELGGLGLGWGLPAPVLPSLSLPEFGWLLRGARLGAWVTPGGWSCPGRGRLSFLWKNQKRMLPAPPGTSPAGRRFGTAEEESQSSGLFLTFL